MGQCSNLLGSTMRDSSAAGAGVRLLGCFIRLPRRERQASPAPDRLAPKGTVAHVGMRRGASRHALWRAYTPGPRTGAIAFMTSRSISSRNHLSASFSAVSTNRRRGSSFLPRVKRVDGARDLLADALEDPDLRHEIGLRPGDARAPASRFRAIEAELPDA